MFLFIFICLWILLVLGFIKLGVFLGNCIDNKLDIKKEPGKWKKLIIIVLFSTIISLVFTPITKSPSFKALILLIIICFFLNISFTVIAFNHENLLARFKKGILGFLLFPYIILIIYIFSILLNLLYFYNLI